jgi:hypothetical protein
VAIFGAPARRYPGQRYAPGAYYDGAATASAYEGSAPAASAPCPNCGTHTQVAMPHSGQWRRSRNGRAIILYLGPRRTAY